MVKHYLAVALRGFLANKLFSFINVFGLAVGLASAILIGLYVADELSYDRFHPDADRLYRIARDFYPEEGGEVHLATLPPRAAEMLRNDYPEEEIAVVARIRAGSALLGRDDQAFYEDGLQFADPEIFDLFRFEWLAGDAASAFATPNSIVLTESLARKYFGDEAPLGQRLTLENTDDAIVTGVIRDLPHNTHLRAAAFLPLDWFLNVVLPEQIRNGWNANITHTYIRLAPGTDIEALVPGTENLNSVPTRSRASADIRNLPPMTVDYGFFETYGIELLAGRLFSEDFPGDRQPEATTSEMTGNFILNASAAREYGWTPEQAIGQPFEVARSTYWISGRIVGVVADSNFESVRFKVKPLVFMLGQQPQRLFNHASVRFTGNNLAGTLASIDSAWKRVVPELPVNRRFLSDNFEALYQNDKRLGQIFGSFAGLAILIACLGLFGLATFNAQRRIKEMPNTLATLAGQALGVRKVMGGSVWSIVLLLTNDFSKLILLSNLVAWPVAYFAMERWLQNFAYRIDLTPMIFIGSGLIALCIAWVTVGGTAAKATGFGLAI